MTKIEEYRVKAVESLAAATIATNPKDRAFHQRAHAVWNRMMAGVTQAEERAALAATAVPKRVKPPLFKRD